jgi:hypothetical protein
VAPLYVVQLTRVRPLSVAFDIPLLVHHGGEKGSTAVTVVSMGTRNQELERGTVLWAFWYVSRLVIRRL